MPVDNKDFQDVPAPIDTKLDNAAGLSLGAAGVLLGPFEMSGYQSVVTVVYVSAGSDVVAHHQWDFFDSPVANTQTEKRKTIISAADPEHSLYANQGTLFWLKLVPTGANATVDYHIAGSNQSPFQTDRALLQLVSSGGGQSIPAGAGTTVLKFDSPVGSEWDSGVGKWKIDLSGGKIVGLHAQRAGTYLTVLTGQWGAPTGVFDKTVNLLTSINSVSFFQTSFGMTLSDTNETFFDLTTIHWVPSDMVGSPGNTIQASAVHANGVAVNITNLRLLVVELATTPPWAVTP